MARLALNLDNSRAKSDKIGIGGMGEWLKPAVLKTVDGETRPGVRIPLPPPVFRQFAKRGTGYAIVRSLCTLVYCASLLALWKLTRIIYGIATDRMDSDVVPPSFSVTSKRMLTSFV